MMCLGVGLFASIIIGCGFFNFVAVGLPFSLISDSSKWWLFYILVVMLTWLWDNESRVYLCPSWTEIQTWLVLRNWLTWLTGLASPGSAKQAAGWQLQQELVLQSWVWNPQGRLVGWELGQDFNVVILRQNSFFLGKHQPLLVRPFNWLYEVHPRYEG